MYELDEYDGDVERLDNYVSPSERRKPTRTPVRKRAADQGASTGSPAKKPTPASVKRERIDPKPRVIKNAPKIIFGLDFGTTYSGIAYTWSDNLDQITPLMNLDDSNQDNPKIPSAINFTLQASGGGPAWGNDAKGVEGSLEWFKLLLVDEDDLPDEIRRSEHVQKARACLRVLDRMPEEVISDYLRGVWKRCLEKMKTEVSQTTVDNSRFHVVITLPAIWPDYARQRMREAVMDAGILNARPGVGDTMLTFVSEPEAAALATLKRVDGRCDIQAGDSFVVCDCGGGTVDIISYKVTSTEPMIVQEIVKGAGALCGAVFLDDEFKALLNRKIEEVSPGARGRLASEELQNIMTDDWEKIRNQFQGEKKVWTIRHPYSLLGLNGPQDLRNGWPKFEVTTSELKEVFDPVVQRIKALVHGQVDAVLAKEDQDPKYVILVGGFGRCKYLYEFLKTRARGVEVLQSQGAEPWTAICRGAVIHGMTVEKMDSRFAVEVRSRIARASYGIVCQEKWDDKKHLPEDKIWDEDQQSWKSKNIVKWLVREGEDVMVAQKFRHNFFKIFDVGNQPEALYTPIWMSKASPPPSRKDDSVFKHSEVKWTAKINMDRLTKFVNNQGKSFLQLDFIAEMKCSGGSTEFSILHNGRRQAAKNVSVEFHDHADI